MTVWNMYVGSFTSEFRHLTGPPGRGIERFTFDDVNAHIHHVETITGLTSPQYLTMHPRVPVLYAAEFGAPGRLTSYSVRPTGSLDHTSTVESIGERSVAINVHPSTNYAYVANYGSGNVVAFSLDPAGVPRSAALNIEADQDDLPPEPERSPRPHHVRTTPNRLGLLVAYAGLDRVTSYAADSDGIIFSSPIAQLELPPASAPRQIEFHPSGNFVYLVGEHDSHLYIIEAKDGLPIQVRDSLPIAPPDFDGRSTPSEIKLQPNVQTLYVGVRGSNSIAMFHLDQSGGFVESADYESAIGRGPRSISLDPTGDYLIVANTDSGDLASFRIEGDGRLQAVGPPVPTASPSSIVFSR